MPMRCHMRGARRLVACLEVYGGPKSHKQSDAGHRFPVACDPFFLLGGSGSDNEYDSSGGIDEYL